MIVLKDVMEIIDEEIRIREEIEKGIRDGYVD